MPVLLNSAALMLDSQLLSFEHALQPHMRWQARNGRTATGTPPAVGDEIVSIGEDVWGYDASAAAGQRGSYGVDSNGNVFVNFLGIGDYKSPTLDALYFTPAVRSATIVQVWDLTVYRGGGSTQTGTCFSYLGRTPQDSGVAAHRSALITHNFGTSANNTLLFIHGVSADLIAAAAALPPVNTRFIMVYRMDMFSGGVAEGRIVHGATDVAYPRLWLAAFNPATPMQIGGQGNGGSGFGNSLPPFGRFYELALWPRYLSDGELNDYIAYLRTAYSI